MSFSSAREASCRKNTWRRSIDLWSSSRKAKPRASCTLNEYENPRAGHDCPAHPQQVGTWLSLVERTLGVGEVASSNLVVPTIFFSKIP
jgi:hypothetical protein